VDHLTSRKRLAYCARERKRGETIKKRGWTSRAEQCLGAFLVGTFCCAAAVLHAELLVSGEPVWGTATPAPAGQVVEYLLCDADSVCTESGIGDPSKAPAPIRLMNVGPGLKTLRARFCDAQATGACGPLSDPSVPFRFEPSLASRAFLARGNEPVGSPIRLQSGNHYSVRIPTGMAPPVSNAILAFDINAPTGPGSLRLEVRSPRTAGSPYLSTLYSFPVGDSSVQIRLASFDDILAGSEAEIEVQIEIVSGTVLLGMADPISGDLRGVHLSGDPLFGALMAFFDSDSDGVPIYTKDRIASCSTNQWLACSDNCPQVSNRRQPDTNRDGEGDACASTSTSNQAPVARFQASPESGIIPIGVRLDASSSYDPEGSPLAYRWDLGVGIQSISSRNTLDLFLESAATFTVTLEVTDPDGNSTVASHQLSFQDPANSSPSACAPGSEGQPVRQDNRGSARPVKWSAGTVSSFVLLSRNLRPPTPPAMDWTMTATV